MDWFFGVSFFLGGRFFGPEPPTTSFNQKVESKLISLHKNWPKKTTGEKMLQHLLDIYLVAGFNPSWKNQIISSSQGENKDMRNHHLVIHWIK